MVHSFLDYFEVHDLGLITVKFMINEGFILGKLHGVSSHIRIVFMCVMVGLVFLFSSFFYAFLSKDLVRIRWGMTFLLSGVAGNSLEKLIYGYVIDFLSINIHPFSRYFFNFSDVFQIVGLVIIVWEIFTKKERIWFETNHKRKKLVLYPAVQLPIAFKVLGMVILGNVTQAILVVALLYPKLKDDAQDIQVLFFLSLLIVNLMILPLIGLYIMKENIRFMGPIFALERYLNDDSDEPQPLRLRKTDYFQELAPSFEKFLSRYKRLKKEPESQEMS